MTELQKLSCRIEAVKDAGTFQKPACAEAALDQLLKVLNEQETRLDKLEQKNEKS